jgi:hypothetical protein
VACIPDKVICEIEEIIVDHNKSLQKMAHPCGTLVSHSPSIYSVQKIIGRVIIRINKRLNLIPVRIILDISLNCPNAYLLIICGFRAKTTLFEKPSNVFCTVVAMPVTAFSTTPKNIFKTKFTPCALKVNPKCPNASHPLNLNIGVIILLSQMNLNLVSS